MLGRALMSVLANSGAHHDTFKESKDCYTVAGEKSVLEVMDVPMPSSGDEPQIRYLRSPFELRDFLARNPFHEVSARIYLLSSKNSFNQLNISEEMLNILMTYHDMDSNILEVLRSFRSRVASTDEAYCVPPRFRFDGHMLDSCYLYKYAEKKDYPTTFPWVIRQTGIYQRYDVQTAKSVCVVMSPMKNSLGELRFKNLLCAVPDTLRIIRSPTLFHVTIINTYLHFWRNFCSFYEDDIQRVSAKLLCNYDGDISPEMLLEMHALEKKIAPLPSVFASVKILARRLRSLSRHVSGDNTSITCPVNEEMLLDEIEDEVQANHENAATLLQLCRTTRELTLETINLKEQKATSALQKITVRHSATVMLITVLTLFYLPSSYVATVMGMNFFELDPKSKKIIISPQFWIYVSICLPLTALTFLAWWFPRLRTQGPNPQLSHKDLV